MTMGARDRKVVERPQDAEVVISVEGVSKKFCRSLKRSLFYGIQDITKELTGLRKNGNKLRTNEFWAVNNVGFQLRRGEALGLVGPNGSGKTTLLRIISGLIKPDTGVVKVRGRIAPLIALGAGLNPILTGRENIYANMSILGLSSEEIDSQFEGVVDFAEIEEAIDAPVQTYSSGMRARLGFACAIHTDPDILLIDEVLSVGDIKFRAKCYRRLDEIRRNNVTFILVSHQPQALLKVCDRAIYIKKGNLVAQGLTHSILKQYEDDLFLSKRDIDENKLGKMLLPEKSETESLGLDITSLFFRDSQGEIIQEPVSGEPTQLCIGCQARKQIEDVAVDLGVVEISGGSDIIFWLNSKEDGEAFKFFPGNHEIQLEMPCLGLKPGLYSMKIWLFQSRLFTIDMVESFRFLITSKGPWEKGIFYQQRKWQVINKI